jgi:hypothetical protein
MSQHRSKAIVLAALLAMTMPCAAFAQSSGDAPASPRLMAPRVIPPLDQEMWAGVSYREALVGLAALGGGAVVVTWLTGSAISGIVAAASLGAAYVVYDPGVTGVLSPNDLPTLSDLSVKGSRSNQ